MIAAPRPRTLIAALATSLAAASAIIPAPAHARALDRRAAVRIALAQNPQIAAARAEEAAVAAQGHQADAARWPIISLTTGVAPSLKAHLVPGTAAQSVEEQYRGLSTSDLSPGLIGELSVIQPLYTFGKIAYRQRAAQHGVEAREAQTRMQRADVALAVAQIYEGYLLARDGVRFMDETIHWLDSTKQATEERLAQNIAGVTEREVLRLDAALGLAKMNLAEAAAGQAQAAAGLAAYLNLPPGEEIAVVEPELELVGRVPGDFAQLVVLANQRRPERVALAQGQLALASLADAEAAGRMPDIFLMLAISAAYTPGRDWLETRFVIDPLNHFIPAAFVGLRWQLQGGMAGARAQEQRAHAEGLYQLDLWASAGIPAEVRRAYEDVRRARAEIDAGTQAVRKAKQWMVQASADYSVGFLDVREVSDAVAAYVSLRASVMKSVYDHNVAMAALAKATGTLDGETAQFYLAPPETPAGAEVSP